jgi:hypothetical protein
VLLVAAAAILGGVVVAALGRAGEMATFAGDTAPIELDEVSATDVALLRPPMSLWGYNAQATEDALRVIARSVTARDVEIATLRRELADLQSRQDGVRTTGRGDRPVTAAGPASAAGPATAASPASTARPATTTSPTGTASGAGPTGTASAAGPAGAASAAGPTGPPASQPRRADPPGAPAKEEYRADLPWLPAWRRPSGPGDQ